MMARRGNRRGGKSLEALAARFGFSDDKVEALRSRNVRAVASFFLAAASPHEKKFREVAVRALRKIREEPISILVREPLAFNLPDGRYTPDFMAVLESGEVVFVEVKASRYDRNLRASKQKIASAATLYPFFTFVVAYVPLRGEPEVHEVSPDGEMANRFLEMYRYLTLLLEESDEK